MIEITDPNIRAKHFILMTEINAYKIKKWNGFINEVYYEGVSFFDKQFLKIINSEEDKINFYNFCLTELNLYIRKS